MIAKRTLAVVLVLAMLVSVLVPRPAAAGGGGGCGGDTGCEDAMIGLAIGTAVLLIAGLLFLWWKGRQRSAASAARPSDKPRVLAVAADEGHSSHSAYATVHQGEVIAESP